MLILKKKKKTHNTPIIGAKKLFRINFPNSHDRYYSDRIVVRRPEYQNIVNLYVCRRNFNADFLTTKVFAIHAR